MWTRLAKRFGHLLLRMTKFIHELAISNCLLNGIEVCALNVLNNCNLKHIQVRKFPHHNGQFMQLGKLRGAPTPFPRDNFIFTGLHRMRTHDQRLYYAFRPNGPCEVIEVIGIKVPTRLVRIWMLMVSTGTSISLRRSELTGPCVSDGLFNICHQRR